MNRTYRLVWSQLSNTWIAVAENAKGKGKSIGGRKLVAAALALAGGSLLSSSAYAADAANASVTSGIGHVSQSGTTTTINQGSQNLAIDWTSLSTAANEALVFNQPNKTAIALNRITGSSPSELLGSLTANGQVFILNPNGVLFGAGAQVNVGGLVASTLGMSNADLAAGRMVFALDGNANGSVVNKGTINAADGGYVALIAGTVRNEGNINARLGTALLAAGNKVTLNINNGSLLGYSIDQGALNALAENKQLIQANGGQVLMSAKALNNLTTAVVNNTGIIEAKTVENRNGRIMLMGDMEVGTVNVSGTLDASALTSGDGGFVETSAAHVKVAAGTKVTTKAANGKTGKWLIDPNDFTIAASGGDMTGADVSANLNNTDFEIQTATMGTAGGNGDINVNDAMTWNAATTLTLSAERNININQSITSQNANGKLSLQYGLGTVSAGNTATYNVKAPVNLQAGDNFSTKLGNDGNTIQYKVITSLGNEGSTTGTDLQGIRGKLSGNYVLGANIDASATASWEGGAGFKPIGAGDDTDFTYMPPVTGADRFIGIFDGLGHTIQNLTVNRPAESYVGLFGAVNGSLKNIGLTASNIIGKQRVGALVGGIAGTVSNSFSNSNVRGQGQVGGLVGFAFDNSKIEHSYTGGTVGEVQNVQAWYVGGLLGYGGGLIDSSYSTANVSGRQYLGGLIGSTDALTTVINSYATGTISGGAYAVGGLAGYNQGLIENSFSTSLITARAIARGGLVGGNTGTIYNSYAAGQINSDVQYSGGLVGKNETNSVGAIGTIRNSYSSTIFARGNSWDPYTIGGLVGSNQGLVENSFWDVARSGISVSSVGISLVGNQLQQASTFTGWDIATSGGSSSVWRIYEGSSAPLLRGLMTALTVTADNVNKTYDGTTISNGSYTLSNTNANSSLILGTATYSSNASKNVGTYDLSVSGLYSNQFGYDLSFVDGNVVINPANLTVTAQQSTKTYDGNTASTVQASIGSVIGTDVISSTGSQSFLDKNAGNNKTVRATGVTIEDANGADMTDNYNFTYIDNNTSTVGKADLHINANGSNRVYNGLVNAGLSYSDDRIAGDELAYSAVATFNDKNVGNGKTINVSNFVVEGADADNYNIIFNTSGFTGNITPALLVVTANSLGKFYDGIAYSSNNGSTITGFVNGETIADLNGALTYGGTAQGAIATGNYTITNQGLSSGNYTLSFVNGALFINPVGQANAALSTSSLVPSYEATRNTVSQLPEEKQLQSLLASLNLEEQKDSAADPSQVTSRLRISSCGMQMPADVNSAACP